MRKTLIMVIIILLIITIGCMIFRSLSVGTLHVPGIRELGEENAKLDSSIQKLSKLNNTDYQNALQNLVKSAGQYKETKKEYNELLEVSTSGDAAAASQLQKYEIEYLWTRIGTHATDEDVVLKLGVQATTTSKETGYYNLLFTASGDYVGITDFIYDIENDSALGFKIENFKMVPATASDTGKNVELEATFTCTNIAINIDMSEIATQQGTEADGEQEGTEAQNSNTTNESATNSSTTSNTTSNTTDNTTSSGTANTDDSPTNDVVNSQPQNQEQFNKP